MVVALALALVATESGRRRWEVTVRQDVVFDPHHALAADVYVPSSPTPRGVVLVVHGGGWIQGSRRDVSAESYRLASEGGLVTIAVSYRTDVTADGGWPAALEDVQNALSWVRGRASEWGGDPDRVGLVGFSAGGHLALLVGELGLDRPWADQPSRGERPGRASRLVDAVVAWSPPIDLAALVPTSTGGPPPGCRGVRICESFWSHPIVPAFVGCTPAQCPHSYSAASPLTHVGAGAAPTLLVNGTRELTPLEPARRLERALKSAGVEARLVVVEGEGHANSLIREAWTEMLVFLRRHLRGGDA